MTDTKSNVKHLAKDLSEEEFAKFVFPFLPTKISGRYTKLPLFQIYNYIGKVLRTGMQWSELQDSIEKDELGKPKLHYTSIFRHFGKWAAFNVFEKSHFAILKAADEIGALNLNQINGDGTNTIAKKGAINAAIQGINTRQVANA